MGEAPSALLQALIQSRSQGDRPLGLDEILLLNHLWRERRTTTDEAARLIQKPDTEARSTLQRLVEAGLVEARGERKGRVYHLSAATYRRLGEKAAYVRQRGFEPVQQEQMVLQYVETHGRITRSEAAELCHLSSPQARNLLIRLAQKDQLLLQGQGRGAFYVLAPKKMDKSNSRMDESKKSAQASKRTSK